MRALLALALFSALCAALVGAAPSGGSGRLQRRKAPWVKSNGWTRPRVGVSARSFQHEVNYERAANRRSKRRSKPVPVPVPVQRRADVNDDGLIPQSEPTPSGNNATGAKQNIWRSLTNDEAASVVAFLHQQADLNLTSADDADEWSNTIGAVDVAMPNKTDALAYLDGGGPVPTRYATAVVRFAATDEPYQQELLVGPLPITNASSYASNDYVTTKGQATIRNYQADDEVVRNYTLAAAQDLGDVIADLLGVNASDTDTYDVFGIDPLWHRNGRVIDWQGFWLVPDNIFDGETLMPLGLYLKLDITGRDPAQWSVLGWLYDDVLYGSSDEFRQAWASGQITHLTQVQSGPWIGTDPPANASTLALDTSTPPMMVETGPKRYSVDADRRVVKWMDFEYSMTFTRDTGLRLYDIKYQGDRIVYEWGLQEALASYAGNDPVQSGTSYMDTYYGFGPYAFEQVPDYDCPAYATYLDATFHAEERSRTHRNAICVFETVKEFALDRHSSSMYTAVSKNAVLVLRTVNTVGNYDYTFDTVFYLDGTIEQVVRASGYIQSAFYAHNEEYGYKIHDALSGSMHDHVLNFKVDVDVLGTANTLAQHVVTPCQIKYKWDDIVRSTMTFKRSYITNENDSQLDWGANGETQWIVVNRDEKNQWGEERGYRFMPSRGGAGMHLTIKDSPNLLNSQYFGTHSFFAVKQKDSEPRSASALNDYDTANPLVDFSKFFDGESLDQQDLVLYVNLGMHHVPHTGDLPTTVMSTAQSAFMFLPHNYLLADPSRRSRQQIRIDHPNADANVTEVHTYGIAQPSGSVAVPAPRYSEYEGDYAVRKFPYDPLNPYNDTEAIV